MNDTELIELLFILDVEDNWPPVSVEGLHCKNVGGSYQIKTAPLFVKNISVNDVISVTFDRSGKVSSWQHVEKSKRSIVWLLRTKNTQCIDDVLRGLRALSCNTVQLPQYGSYSIDIPEDLAIHKVDECLERLNVDCVAIAYSSFRHEE
ncbi:MAG TPA: DUF4265 domain-containing protein [Cellvibrio sp.]|nr:DUF4265 domain-containing protein [Cellvibrio sp.]